MPPQLSIPLFALCVASVASPYARADASVPAESEPEQGIAASAGAAPVPAPTPANASTHAPRMSSVTLGYDWSPKNALPVSTSDGTFRPMGLALEGRYGWQVGGLGAGKPAWIGMSASFFAHTRGAPRSTLGVDYGLFVRHALSASETVRPFFGYGLGAAQLFVRGVDGRGLGHMTALSLGVDVRATTGIHATFEVSYRFLILPTFETAVEGARRYDLHTLRLVVGALFGG